MLPKILTIWIRRVCQIDKDVIDDGIRGGQNQMRADGISRGKGTRGESDKNNPRKWKGQTLNISCMIKEYEW